MNIELMKQSQLRCKRRAYEKHIMNLKEKFSYLENIKLIRFSNRCGNHMNCFRFNLSEDIKHIIKKLEICIELLSKNHKFITEGIFLNGSRCDIIDLTNGVIYEVINTESEKRFEEKIEKYPKEFKILKINVQKID